MEDLTVQQTGIDNDNWRHQNQAIQGIVFVEYLQIHRSWKTIAWDKFSRLIYKSGGKTSFGGGCQAQRKFVLQQISVSDICL